MSESVAIVEWIAAKIAGIKGMVMMSFSLNTIIILIPTWIAAATLLGMANLARQKKMQQSELKPATVKEMREHK